MLDDPAAWAAKAEKAGAELIALSLDSAHPERGDTGAAEARKTVRRVLQATSLPLIVYGPGQKDKDNEVLVAAAEEAAGERIALGNCEEKNYRTIVAAAFANDQVIVAKSPIDVNLAKQLNVLIGDMGMESGADPDGSHHRGSGLRHRVQLLGDGAGAAGRAER